MIQEVQTILPRLSSEEQRIGRLLCDDPSKFSTLTTAGIALECYVSKPAVARFCKSLGFLGLSHLKQRLCAVSEFGVPFVHQRVNTTDKPSQVFRKVMDSAAAAIACHREQSSDGQLTRAINALEFAYRGKHVLEFHAAGDAAPIALDAQNKFCRLGFSAQANCDSHMQLMNAALRKPGDVVVAISISGRTKDLIDAADMARRKGATLIAITASESTLSSLADVHIVVDSMEDVEQYTPMTSRLMHMLVIDVLSTSVALRIYDDDLQSRLADAHSLLRNRRLG